MDVVHLANAQAASLLLEVGIDDIRRARIFARTSLQLLVIVEKGMADYRNLFHPKDVLVIMENGALIPWVREHVVLISKLESDRQLVRYLAKRLPCHCLDECLKQMTKEVSTNEFFIVTRGSLAKTASDVQNVAMQHTAQKSAKRLTGMRVTEKSAFCSE